MGVACDHGRTNIILTLSIKSKTMGVACDHGRTNITTNFVY